ncbi:hypothetical protein TVAG_085470 [Trichomonas vaginalis G3]|uniref:Uncharacterized protein n=1 Tax=Trichomonas vaginalis (strain ATCC PRA-98 / G3) TaxID=412133 RepID=A2F2Y8_TRIV3|nr:hypothetical protein TVAGG3_0829480 [Trichomonas vaginalis G3]EAY00713.1 hypothetical protein TVAG_085470 [Trichomonas vaginalis G3]KAI5498477.1 hypothetical protein TVAGG3_0829480 [Trichomonas vaginalis G3]|eukprot:XP_001313642.1 hypothetical protein [Trichomonas vaginalis G3]
MGEPIRSETFPLYFEYDPAHKLNYFKNTSQPQWMLNQEKQPIYLWQPTVDPGPNGGTVHNEQMYVRKRRTDFKAASRRPDPIPNQEPWALTTGDGTKYTLTCDESQRTHFAVITPEKGRYVLNLLSDSFVITKDVKEQDADECERLAEDKLKASYDNRKAFNKKYVKLLEEEAKARKENFIQSLRDENDDEEFEDVDDQSLQNIGDKDVVKEIKKRGRQRAEDDDIDAEVDFHVDDEEFLQDDVVEDVEEVLGKLSESDFETDSEEDGEEEDKKDKKKKQTPAVTKPVAEEDIKKIAIEVTGEKPIKEEELVRYFMDVGRATLNDINSRFKNQYLQTEHQRHAFMQLLKKNCKKITKDKIIYFSLK